MNSHDRLNVLLIGGGMISQEVVLPTLLQERHRGIIGGIAVSALNSAAVKQCQDLFPGEELVGYPGPAEYAPDDSQPQMYRDAMATLGDNGVVVVATPDHLHTRII